MTRWTIVVIGGLLLLGAQPVWAQEEITLQTYYPSPRGVYNELRTVGDVHIGSTAPPAARLHILQEDAVDVFLVEDELGDLTPFVIDQDGNVGIGITGSVVKLAIKQNFVNLGIRLESATNTDFAEIGMDGAAPNPHLFIRNQNGDIRFIQGAIDLLRITNAGNVGIGTAIPTRLLHVAGTEGMHLDASAQPGTPTLGDIIIDTVDDTLKWYDGTVWRSAGVGVSLYYTNSCALVPIPGPFQGCTTTCTAGDVMTGGGVDAANWDLVRSAPVGGDGWDCVAGSAGTCYVRCQDITP